MRIDRYEKVILIAPDAAAAQRRKEVAVPAA